MRQYKRRNYVINRRLQFGLITVVLTSVLAASAAAVFGTAFFLQRTHALDPVLFLDTFLMPILINDLAVMAAVVIVLIFYSNRIAGPLFHMDMVIRAVLDGDTTRRVRLRPKDFAASLAESLNSLLDEIEK